MGGLAALAGSLRSPNGPLEEPNGGSRAVRHGGAARTPPFGAPSAPLRRGHWIRLCQVRLRHAASVLGIIDGCVVACCRIF